TAGRTNTTLKSLKVGDREVHGVPFTLFELPVQGMDGMLGIGWLRENRVLVDYSGLRLGFSSDERQGREEDARLVRHGFKPHRMEWDPDR
ncbi:hypothetical protein ACJENY_24705, partial [Escherichia coli]